jgi:hypothetical protein
MRTGIRICVVTLLCATGAYGASKPHVIVFGKAVSVKWFVGSSETTPIELRVRPLVVDARTREFTSGSIHEITERLFVVRRVFRVNDALPEESPSARTWKWERGGWLLVDRFTGRISPVSLPDFDPYYSNVSWYRDYVAYCGVSEETNKISALVVQVGRRKPLLKKSLGAVADGQVPDSACTAPVWQRQPARVTFDAGKEQKFVFTVRGHALDVVSEDEDDEPAE